MDMYRVYGNYPGGLAVQKRYTMNNTMTFGQYEGRTFEWLFFKQPRHAQRLYAEGIHLRPDFGDAERAYFLEIYRRANRLNGPCPGCGKPITRMGLSATIALGLPGVQFLCETCEFQDGCQVEYYPASFFVDERILHKSEQKMIQHEISHFYIGQAGRLTQTDMEAFFRNDATFYDCTPGFFEPVAAR